MCVGILPACKDVEHIHVVLADRGQKDSDPLELEFHTMWVVGTVSRFSTSNLHS